jgi:NCAIR mutase (PurE)-related protein
MLKLKLQPYEDLGFAKLDYHRELRQGIAEVIYGAGNTRANCRHFQSNAGKWQNTILITRMSKEAASYVRNAVHRLHIMKWVGRHCRQIRNRMVWVPSCDHCGTSDMPVAEEAH